MPVLFLFWLRLIPMEGGNVTPERLPERLAQYLYIDPRETWILSEYPQPTEQPTNLREFLISDLLGVLQGSHLGHHSPDEPPPAPFFRPETVTHVAQELRAILSLEERTRVNQSPNSEGHSLFLNYFPISSIRPTHHYLTLNRPFYTQHCGNFFCRNHFPTYKTLTTFCLITPPNPTPTNRAGYVHQNITRPTAPAKPSQTG